eukprot:CAMPEP_0171286046 /NCGR_PEP_ID=MMETSP0790-20130122/68802_1 /TAXON_ID=2925 /ORGANISM="Alexandrium catenella, Strain OF101" /LENGTH=72 /DNA_ID=CAMNT_0011755461 /DNA_START=267 /DNA_END=482 /DNA_ORIENTATION=-
MLGASDPGWLRPRGSTCVRVACALCGLPWSLGGGTRVTPGARPDSGTPGNASGAGASGNATAFKQPRAATRA